MMNVSNVEEQEIKSSSLHHGGAPFVDPGFWNMQIDRTSLRAITNRAQETQISLAGFVATRFVPDHVEQKSFAGRKHYHSMLKHILRPETADALFLSGSGPVKSRLKAIPDWPYLDEVAVSELHCRHVQALTAAASAHGYSSQTVKHIRNVLGAIISHARRDGLYSGENPVSTVELPPVCHKSAPQLSVSQAKAILSRMRSPEREIALLTITTGMRISEICGLQWKHLNLTRGICECDGERIAPASILVKQQRNPEGIATLNPNRIRLVDIPEPIIGVLLELKKDSADRNGFVIATSDGAPLLPAQARMLQLKPIGRKLQMPWLSWRFLSQAHASLLSEMRYQLSRDLVSSIR